MPPGVYLRPPLEWRVWVRVDRSAGPFGCWPWSGGTNGHGYGQIKAGGAKVMAHRVAYELLIGPIPAGMTLDHLCRNRLCVNPVHLEAVTNRVNILRGTSPAAIHARKVACPNGHPYSGRERRGTRICHTCMAARKRRRNREKELIHVPA